MAQSNDTAEWLGLGCGCLIVLVVMGASLAFFVARIAFLVAAIHWLFS